jgi:hypothetical protein
MRGTAAVATTHVEHAGHLLGSKKLLGLDSSEMWILQRVKESGDFRRTSEEHVALLVTGRVLEYPNRERPFAVHPSMRPTPKRS